MVGWRETLKRLLFAAAAVALTACSALSPQTTRPPLDSAALTAAVGASGQPVSNVKAFTAEHDVNHLLGRPNQYVAKVSWDDSRLANGGQGTIEVFASVEDLRARQKYTQAISDSAGARSQYIVPNEERLALMRLPHQLTPEQAEAYKGWFASL